MAAHEQEGAGRQKERLSGLLGVARAASCARLRAVTQPRTFAPSRRPASGLGPRASSSSVHHSPPRPKAPPPADAAALGSRRLQPGERHPPTTHTTDQHSLSTGVLCKMACIAAASKATTTGRPFGGREPTPCDPPPHHWPCAAARLARVRLLPRRARNKHTERAAENRGLLGAPRYLSGA